jgi:RimJ/RimL family protein N-acetyltransferase
MICEEREAVQHEDCILRTGRLVLRRPRASDAEGVARLANDRWIAENTAMIPHPYTLANAKDWIAGIRADDKQHFLAFAEIDGVQTLVGAGGLSEGEGGVLDLGYWLGAPFRGKGYATEIARALVDYAFEQIGVDRITVSCRVTNTASRRVIEKCGFQWSGCGLASSLGFKGAFPVDRFRLERWIWESLVSWGRNRSGRRIVPQMQSQMGEATL